MIACNTARPPTCGSPFSGSACRRPMTATSVAWIDPLTFHSMASSSRPVWSHARRGSMNIRLVAVTIAFVERRSFVAPASAARIDRRSRSATHQIARR